ncbi:glycosyl hydrolase family 61-domain-containing protein, partial [Lophiotrema nucula]
SLGAFAGAALAHGTVTGYVADGAYFGGYKLDYYYMIQNGQTPPETSGWYAEDLDNGFVSPDAYTTDDIICHKAAKPLDSTTGKVAAGGKVEFQWTAWPESHIGPVITYVAPYTGDAADIDKTTLKWVKIDASGYNTDTKSWAAVDMIANNNTWVTTVPSTLKAGTYVFRHEIIALHGAGSENGAQNYPQCMNIEVTGSGTELPEGTLGTALYTPTDPGILFNPYTTITSYDIPGPALFGSSDSGNTTTPVDSPAPASSAPVVTSAPPATTAAPQATVTSFSTAVVSVTSTVVEVVDAPTATSSAVPAPTSTGTAGAGDALPETFTIDTFITWLKKQAGSTSSKAKRAHPRA